jgi:phage tail sheath protein FI
MIIVSPGVYTREIDLSNYIPQLATAIFGVVGTASKGPVNEVTLITDEASLISTFGEPSANHLGLYTAIRYLKKGNQLKFVRVASYDATAAQDFNNAADTQVAMAVSAVSTGSWGNDITITVANGTAIDPETGASTYKIVVYSNGSTTEIYDLVVFDPAHSTAKNYITTRINGVSDYITVAPVAGQSTLLLHATAVSLIGGDDGAPVSDADYVGTVGLSGSVPATGLQLFANGEDIDVNLIAVSDVSHASVISAMIDICQNRGDCMCLVDVPQGKSVQEAVAWANGLGGGLDDPAAPINTTYAAIFYPWVQVFDGYSNANVWIPPSGHVAGVIAYTDYNNDPWWAPAGLQRAILADVLAIEHSATQGERDYMYANGNVVNPIINYQGQGIVIWGQRTATRNSTSLDRINVRRLLLTMRKQIATATAQLVFQPNDEDTWADFRNLVDPLCADIKARRGLTNYSVICDASTNTAAVRARKEMRAKIIIQPTEAAEMISIDFAVVNNEAQFSEV